MDRKYFANSKTLLTFVMSNITIGKYACRLLVAGFFYTCTITICSATPVWRINVSTTADGVLDNRSVALFFIATKQINSCDMYNTETKGLQVNNSNEQTNKQASLLKGAIKKIPKKFGSIKNKRTFVVFYATEHKQKEQEVFFYAKDIGYQTPFTNYLSSICSCSVAGTEGDSLFYIKKFNNLIH